MYGYVRNVTGETKGSGNARASRRAEAGAKVFVSSRKADVCDDVAAEINEKWAKNGGEAMAVPCHVSYKDQLKQLVDTTLQKRPEEHTSELPSLMRISYAVFCLKRKK